MPPCQSDHDTSSRCSSRGRGQRWFSRPPRLPTGATHTANKTQQPALCRTRAHTQTRLLSPQPQLSRHLGRQPDVQGVGKPRLVFLLSAHVRGEEGGGGGAWRRNGLSTTGTARWQGTSKGKERRDGEGEGPPTSVRHTRQRLSQEQEQNVPVQRNRISPPSPPQSSDLAPPQ